MLTNLCKTAEVFLFKIVYIINKITHGCLEIMNGSFSSHVSIKLNTQGISMLPLFSLSILTLISCDSKALVNCGQVYNIRNFYQATEEIQSSDPFPQSSDRMGSHITSLPKNWTFDKYWIKIELTMNLTMNWPSSLYYFSACIGNTDQCPFCLIRSPSQI